MSQPAVTNGISTVEQPSVNQVAVSAAVSQSSTAEPVSTVEIPQGNSALEQKENTTRINALSLSSIQKRRALESSLEQTVVNPEDLPRNAFTYDSLMNEWKLYQDKLSRSGFMLMSSLMGMTPPRLAGSHISLEMPNAGSKLSFDEYKYELVNHLRKRLKNYDIEIEIIVNEEVKLVKKVFDNNDKLKHFIQLNDNVRLLKEKFELEF
ncbi:hypothetical protein [Myroides pelagicus]|uniref:DNA polymerase III subunit gamma/tau n=1 Tax=Myroides pelagicus TaxID=270914 RepID=A0A7K1GKB4_9FLAO|nr:hypothetical protein [Myroides pelagicus]MEC4113457.1 hypothetical protein [Myroides pelagicus]MTH29256.1 hypothetical protein [Myroides pelagicus]